ncbi:MAG: hypothetical protein NC418_07335 [Muribaculaceae bacterium]|nr:hypothetical protein [Muribaculaceae bacterium]
MKAPALILCVAFALASAAQSVFKVTEIEPIEIARSAPGVSIAGVWRGESELRFKVLCRLSENIVLGQNDSASSLDIAIFDISSSPKIIYGYSNRQLAPAIAAQLTDSTSATVCLSDGRCLNIRFLPLQNPQYEYRKD